jgi:hypothetical protein
MQQYICTQGNSQALWFQSKLHPIEIEASLQTRQREGVNGRRRKLGLFETVVGKRYHKVYGEGQNQVNQSNLVYSTFDITRACYAVHYPFNIITWLHEINSYTSSYDLWCSQLAIAV